MVMNTMVNMHCDIIIMINYVCFCVLYFRAVSNVLTNLKGIATDMGTELDRQNNQLDRINVKADANIVHLENTNRRIARQL